MKIQNKILLITGGTGSLVQQCLIVLETDHFKELGFFS